MLGRKRGIKCEYKNRYMKLKIFFIVFLIFALNFNCFALDDDQKGYAIIQAIETINCFYNDSVMSNASLNSTVTFEDYPVFQQKKKFNKESYFSYINSAKESKSIKSIYLDTIVPPTHKLGPNYYHSFVLRHIEYSQCSVVDTASIYFSFEAENGTKVDSLIFLGSGYIQPKDFWANEKQPTINLLNKEGALVISPRFEGNSILSCESNNYFHYKRSRSFYKFLNSNDSIKINNIPYKFISYPNLTCNGLKWYNKRWVNASVGGAFIVSGCFITNYFSRKYLETSGTKYSKATGASSIIFYGLGTALLIRTITIHNYKAVISIPDANSLILITINF